MRDKPQTEHKTVQKRKYFQSMEPMTGTNNLSSRENVLFVMLEGRKQTPIFAAHQWGLLCSLL